MSLDGVRILLVEDEPIIAMTAEDMLEDLGCRVVVSAATLAEALAAADRDGFDIALLDINLNGVDSYPVAARLRADGRPFIFTTGYGPSGRDAAYAEVPLVTKPYQLGDLQAPIAAALGR